MPKVSVIVPVYNVEKYLIKCFDSLVNQTLEDIEIIAVNDGSTDKSGEILNIYRDRFPDKMKVVEKSNGGLSDARNYGIPYASGEYVAFLDSDDYVELDMYEKMYLKAVSENLDYVECDFIWEYPTKSKVDVGIEYKDKKDMLVKARVVAWNKLIRKSVLDKAKVEFPKGLRYEDVEFFYKMLPYFERVGYVREPLIHYIQRENSISNNQNERTGEIFTVLDNVINYYKEKGLYDEYKSELEYTYTRLLLCSSLFRMVKIADKEVRKRLLNETWDRLNSTFSNWKRNGVLCSNKCGKNLYMKTVNKWSFGLYCKIFQIIK